MVMPLEAWSAGGSDLIAPVLQAAASAPEGEICLPYWLALSIAGGVSAAIGLMWRASERRQDRIEGWVERLLDEREAHNGK